MIIVSFKYVTNEKIYNLQDINIFRCFIVTHETRKITLKISIPLSRFKITAHVGFTITTLLTITLFS